jgi:putative tricarboxylic transport membrane protein
VAERDRLVRLLQRLEQTPEWGAAVQRAGWTNAFLPADEFGAFLAEQDRDVRATLARLNLR